MVKYWMHNNMITIAGRKMGKSYNNFITLDQFFTGQHELLEQAYSPMTIRFFILQAHYRSTVDFSNEALQASTKGLERLMDAIRQLERITPETAGALGTDYADEVAKKCYEAMDDDFNSPIVISHLFDACRTVNQLVDHKQTITAEGLDALRRVMRTFAFDILGLREEEGGNAERETSFGGAIDLLLDLRAKAKAAKDWATSDEIRDRLAALGFEVKDTKDGATWKLNK
jgi:cysteinyl-tRNA synthetase